MKQNLDYGYDIQKLYLEMMLADSETFSRCQSIFDPTLFDKKLRKTAEFLVEYVKEHTVLPPLDIINVATASQLNSLSHLESEHFNWLLNEFETFTKHKALEKAILSSADLLENGEYGAVEALVKAAVQIGLTKDIGTDYWANPRERLQRIKSNNGQISTGWPTLDRLLFGGVNRGELSILSAGSGVGKSLFLANLSVNWALAGLNVAYITHELSEEMVSMRIDSMITGVPSREIFKKIEDVETKVKLIGKKSGQLQIKYIPSGKNVNDIRTYLKEYEVRTRAAFDILIVDYMDLLHPVNKKISTGDLFIKDKHVSEELRNLATEKNTVVVTAAQLNRCLCVDTIVNINNNNTPIKYANIGDTIETKYGHETITEVLPATIQQTYRITTDTNHNITCSANHKFPVHNELKSINTGLQLGNELWVRNYGWTKIIDITTLGLKQTVDINITGTRTFYANDILTHNSAVEEIEFDHSHIAGGISKIQTADNVFGIFSSRQLRERGKYQLQLMKTRSSSGLGQKIELDYDVDTLRITDNELNDFEQEDKKINAEVKSTKLRDLLNQLTTD